jgi:hypothetical protein
MGTMKDALAKIGIKEAVKVKIVPPNERTKIAKKKVTEDVVYQEQRNFCEVCDQVRPDVEYYKHRNPTTDAEWICIRCADQLQIPDMFRQTAQSDTCIRKMFRREYGATLHPSEIKGPKFDSNKPKGPSNGNR